MLGFHLDYFICCVIAVLGIVILASAHRTNRLRPPVYLLSTILMVSAAALFFSTSNRVLNDHEGGLDANEQAIIFALSGLTGLFTYKSVVFLRKYLMERSWRRFLIFLSN